MSLQLLGYEGVTLGSEDFERDLYPPEALTGEPEYDRFGFA